MFSDARVNLAQRGGASEKWRPEERGGIGKGKTPKESGGEKSPIRGDSKEV